jgi:hypothetical protein
MSDTEHLDWAENIAVEHLKGRLATADVLLAQSNQLLNLVLTGMAGAIAFGVKVFSAGNSAVDWGCAALSVWLALTAVMLITCCIRTRSTPCLYNEPKHVYPLTDLPLDQIRAYELENMQARIDQAKDRNRRVACWLDRCRYMASATPICFGIAVTLASYLKS